MRHSAQGICQQVWNALERFRGEEIQHDDVTLMTVKVK
jgi:serine phosphatase RsbU (regulator of sigma subunit)